MENYFNQSYEEKLKDAKPDLFYQVGSTPERTELPRDNSEVSDKYTEDNKATKVIGKDNKWRFFWKAGLIPEKTKFPLLNPKMEQVIPKSFKDWEKNMDKWAKLMLDATYSVTELISLGFGFKKNKITDLLKYGPHLLAPTGSDLKKYGELNTILAGYHYDLSFLTIHGKSRFPGLFIWLRDGTKVLVKVPDGCLLLQAGKQLEWLTGGYIIAGFHEVIVSSETIEVIKKKERKKEKFYGEFHQLYFLMFLLMNIFIL